MIVVSDTSVISNLYLVDHLQLLPKLFHNVIIPPKVYAELQALQQFNIDIQPIVKASWLSVQAPPMPGLFNI